MPDQKKMDRYRLLQAAGLAQFSTCSRRQVGAVLVNREGKIVGEGYNGVPSGEVHCIDGGCPRGLLSYDDAPAGIDYNLYPCHALHAEHNAVLLAGIDKARGGTIYVTDEPCTQCSTLIKHVGIERVVVREGLDR